MPPACDNIAKPGVSSRSGVIALVTVSGPDMLLTRAEAAEVASVAFGAPVDVERIRTWERRDHLERAGLNDLGQPVYTALGVAKAAHKMRGYTRVAAA